MLTSVTVRDVLGANKTFNLTSAIQADTLQIRDISGLGPVKNNLTTNPRSTNVGVIPTAKQIGARNIVIKLGLNPNWATQTMADLRLEAYKWFMPGQEIDLRFVTTHLPQVHIWGTVESCEPTFFTEEPELQVSIMCMEPEFVAVSESIASELFSEPTPYSEVINYEGQAPTGVNLIVSKPVSEIGSTYVGPLLYTRSHLGVMQTMQVGVNPYNAALPYPPIVYGTYLALETQRSIRSLYNILEGPGTLTNMMHTMIPGAQWLTLMPGNNILTVRALRINNSLMRMQRTYYARYWGL